MQQDGGEANQRLSCVYRINGITRNDALELYRKLLDLSDPDMEFVIGRGLFQRTFPAHSKILCAVSDYCSRAVRDPAFNGRLESQEQLDATAFEDLLLFSYQFQLQGSQVFLANSSLIFGMLKCADYYMMLDVHKALRAQLSQLLSPNSVLQLLDGAVKYKDHYLGKELYENILSYVVWGYPDGAEKWPVKIVSLQYSVHLATTDGPWPPAPHKIPLKLQVRTDLAPVFGHELTAALDHCVTEEVSLKLLVSHEEKTLSFRFRTHQTNTEKLDKALVSERRAMEFGPGQVALDLSEIPADPENGALLPKTEYVVRIGLADGSKLPEGAVVVGSVRSCFQTLLAVVEEASNAENDDSSGLVLHFVA